MKLVSEEGGEALANTSWAVTTQDGITVNESVGAFPTLILADGKYTAVAKHQEQIYSRDFTVEAGLQRDIEVRLADLVPPDAVSGMPSAQRAAIQWKPAPRVPPAEPVTGDQPAEPPADEVPMRALTTT